MFPRAAFPVIFFVAAGYQILAILASLNHLRRRYKSSQNQSVQRFKPPVSVLKPLRGLDPNTFEAFVSHAVQDYPEFELLFGVADDDDLAADQVRRLQEEFPGVAIRLIVGKEPFSNGKVGVLAHLAKHARHDVWLVNDSDIKVGQNYLSAVVSPLENASVGIVTCLYRATAHTAAAAWEALGIAAEFMPSTLVAQALGVREFGLGSTLVFRAKDLRRAGGFDSIGNYLADDYQLAKRITSSGQRALLSTYTVETSLKDATWRGSWEHQLRWARTIRFSKSAGYAGLPVTYTGLWIAVALLNGFIGFGVSLLFLRMISAFLSAFFVVSSDTATRLFWLAPLRDVYSFAVWFASYAGREVRWRDRLLTIDNQGCIQNARRVNGTN